jgi:hypothetical protein
MPTAFREGDRSAFRCLPVYPVPGESISAMGTCDNRQEPWPFRLLVVLAFALMLVYILGPFIAFVFLFPGI